VPSKKKLVTSPLQSPAATISVPSEKGQKFVIIDGHALIYRAYHAFHDLSTPEGLLVNAVYGFSRILLTVIRDLEPTYIAVAFDCAEPTFRHIDYLGYKANRAEMPEDMKPQIDIIKEIVTAFNIPQFALPGYEADDIIGTMVTQLKPVSRTHDLTTIIVTGDRDAFQLVDEYVHVWMPGRSKPIRTPDMEYEAEGVVKKMGVTPGQIIDLKALMGDASDNIPGVAGVGAKTAVKLIQEFGSLEKIYQTIQEQNLTFEASKHPTLRAGLLKKLAIGHQDAVMSQKLATIECDVPITLELEKCRLSGYKKDDVIKIFERLSFTSLMRLLPADAFELEVQTALF